MAVNVSATTPANGTAAIHTLITLLLAAGWTIPQWSDGTANGSGGVGSVTVLGSPATTNPYTAGSGAGADALGNANAWFRITAPGGSREWLFKRTSDTSWTVKRGRTGFTGTGDGAHSLTVAPTDATSTTFFSAATCFTTMGPWLLSVDTVSGGWTAFMVPTGGGNVKTILADEPLKAGTYPTTGNVDADPYLGLAYYDATGFAVGSFVCALASTANCTKRFLHGLGGASNVRVQYSTIIQAGSAVVVLAPANSTTAQMAPEPYNGTEVPEEIPVCAHGATSNTTGRVGKCGRHRWSTVFALRANGKTIAASGGYWIYMAGVWVPWDSSTPTI